MPAVVKTIGLTGGIGSGKTTVAQILEGLGAAVIHADAVGHEIYLPNTEGWRRVVEAFGTEVLKDDRTVDRRKLGALVFHDAEGLKRLNAIAHPLMFAEIRRRIQSYRRAGRSQPVVLEAAVLIEANWLPLVDEVWLVVADRAAVIERVTAQRGLSRREVATRIGAQLSDSQRRQAAQVVIENTGSIADLRKRVRSLWRAAVAPG
ncbi:MAG: dephospho-CoA kinase [Candidatus Binatia bacterium]